MVMQLLINNQVIDQQLVQEHLTRNERYLRKVICSLVNRNTKAIILTGQYPEFCLAVRSKINNPGLEEVPFKQATEVVYAG
jgi:hypothetical protein